VDRRKERAAWDLRIEMTGAGQPTSARLLLLDGSERQLPIKRDEGALLVRIEPATEVCAVRFSLR
jgi:hypothetical protein